MYVRRAGIGALALLTAVMLSACGSDAGSASGNNDRSLSEQPQSGSASQSVEDACAAIEDDVTDARMNVTQLTVAAAEDPSGSLTELNSYVTVFEEIQADLGNAEVQAAVEDYSTALVDLTELLQSMVDSPHTLDGTALILKAGDADISRIGLERLCDY